MPATVILFAGRFDMFRTGTPRSYKKKFLASSFHLPPIAP